MLKVLLVDDEPVTLKALKVLINWNELGYTVCSEARDGKAALEAILQHSPDIVITDIRMPGMDGISLIQQCRMQKLLSIKFIILSGYGDFQYAQQAIKFGVADYLLKPLDEDALTEVLKRLQQEIGRERRQEQLRLESTHNALRNRVRALLQSGRIPDGAMAASILDGLRMKDENSLRYVTIKILGGSDREGASEPASSELVADYLEKNYRFFAVDADETHLSLLYLHKDMDAAQIGGVFSSLQRELSRVFGLQTAILVGMRGQGLEDLPRSRDSVRKLETNFYFYEQRDMLFWEEFENQDCSYDVGDILKTDGVIKGIAECDLTGAGAALDAIFDGLKSRHVSMDAVKIFLNNVAIEIIKLINSLQGDAGALIKANAAYINALESMTLGEAREKTLRLCYKAISLVETLKKQGFKGIVNDAENFIAQNYMKDINLKIVADRLHINPAYLGQQFMKKTGRHFNDYLNEIRIEAAKKYLAASSLKVYEVAEKVGFKNTDYFTSKFQKLERMSPTEYRVYHEGKQ